MEIFDDLEDGDRETLHFRLHSLIAKLSFSPIDQAELTSALAFHGLDQPAGLERAPLVAIEKRLEGRLQALPLAALLTKTLAADDPLNHDFDRLIGWAIVASLVLSARDPDHESKIDDALASVRLLYRKKERFVLEWFEGKTGSALEVASVANAKRGPIIDIGLTIDRGADIHVLLRSYLEDKAPIIHRSHGEDDDIYYVTEIAPVADFDLDDDCESINVVHTIELLRQNGDPINPEHSSHRVTALVSARGAGGGRQPGAHRRHRDTIAVQSILRRRMALPCFYGALTNHEIETILKSFHGMKGPDWRARLLIILCLVTGRSPEMLLALPKSKWDRKKDDHTWWQQRSDTISLCYDAQLPSRNYRGSGQDLFKEEKPEPLVLTLPNELASPLKRLLQDQKRGIHIPSPVDDVFKSLWSTHHRAVTLRRTASVIRDRVIQGGHDGSIAAYIAGDSPQNIPALYYVEHDNSAISDIFRKVVNSLPSASFTWPAGSANLVGSRLQPTPVMIRGFYSVMDGALKQAPRYMLPEKLKFHNRYVAMVWTSLSLMTGHRPVRRPFETLSDFDLKNGLLYVSDKELRSVSAGRFVPLVKCAVQQIQAWLEHLARFINMIDDHTGDLRATVKNARDGTGPLFFWLDLGDTQQIRIEPVAPKRLDQELQAIWPLPLNWGRHVQRSALTNLPSDLVDAFMGHSDPGAEPFGPQSGFGLHDLSDLRDKLEALARLYRVRVFKGIQ
jgi:hypothetical protein